LTFAVSAASSTALAAVAAMSLVLAATWLAARSIFCPAVCAWCFSWLQPAAIVARAYADDPKITNTTIGSLSSTVARDSCAGR